MYKLFDKTTKSVQRKLSYSKLDKVKEIFPVAHEGENENMNTSPEVLLSKDNCEQKANIIQDNIAMSKK